MKKSAIKDIFHGVRGYIETMDIPKNVHGNADMIRSFYDKLKEKLNPELLNLHQKLMEAIESDWCEEVDFYFAEGFKLGLLIGIECMEN